MISQSFVCIYHLCLACYMLVRLLLSVSVILTCGEGYKCGRCPLCILPYPVSPPWFQMVPATTLIVSACGMRFEVFDLGCCTAWMRSLIPTFRDSVLFPPAWGDDSHLYILTLSVRVCQSDAVLLGTQTETRCNTKYCAVDCAWTGPVQTFVKDPIHFYLTVQFNCVKKMR